jgi:hypothetical protein
MADVEEWRLIATDDEFKIRSSAAWVKRIESLV